VIVPNTIFLEKNVTNWTLGDQIQSATVRVGVGYESDVKKVEQVCLQAMREVEPVLQDRDMVVRFSDFGDSALIFDVSFQCVAHTTGQRKRVESEVRFKLHELFAQNRISLPFPQRDVNLNVSNPLAVKIQ
jgi:small-conductance mechanosensitive channel